MQACRSMLPLLRQSAGEDASISALVSEHDQLSGRTGHKTWREIRGRIKAVHDELERDAVQSAGAPS